MADGNGSDPIQLPAPRAVLVIRWEQDGRIAASFPQDPIVAYGMLGEARRQIDNFFAEREKSARIAVPNGIERRLLG